MIPAAFDYVRAGSIAEAIDLLKRDPEGTKLVAGGHTLIPTLKLRLASPALLVDIRGIADLKGISVDDQTVRIGALTTHAELLASEPLYDVLPIFRQAANRIADPQVRNRGTIGGSLANADPAAEIALVAVTLGATISYRDGRTSGELAAADFFIGPMSTALSPTACLTAVHFPVWRGVRVGVGFHEVNARRSDFAFASAAAQIAVDEAGMCTRLALGIGAVTAVPRRLHALEMMLRGSRAEEGRVRETVAAVLSDIDPLSDLHASADYRRRAAATLLTRAIADSWREAHRQSAHAR